MAIGLVLATVPALVAAAPSPTRAAEPRLLVFAAASLTEVVQALAPRFADARVSASFGGSGTLARQIRDGAPADVFLSASPDWIDFLRAADALDGEAVPLARNRLVCIAPAGSPLAAAGGVTGPRDLPGRLDDGALVGIADPGVPAGEYARAALRRFGLLADLERRLVGQKDVRAVLHAVEQGELDAGFVYVTDARVAAVEVLFAFDASTHPPIEYRAAVLRGAARPDAARGFLDFLRSDEARAVLTEAGFEVP